MRNAPAVDSAGHVILQVGERLLALEQREDRPKVLWEYVIGSRAPGPVVLLPDDSIRLHCCDGCLHGISSSGAQQWPPAPVGQPMAYAAPTVDDEGNTYVSSFEGGLVRVDAEGRVKPAGPYFRSRQTFNSCGILRGGVLYIGSEEGCVSAIQLGAERGTNLWNHSAGQGATGWYLHSSPAMMDDGVLVVAGSEEHLYGFAPDGRAIWKTALPGQAVGSPVVDRQGHVYVGVSRSPRAERPRGALVCVDANGHQIRWKYEAAGPVESTPAIGDDDTIYFGDDAGTIHAVDFAGRMRWTAQFEAPVRSAGTILAPGRLAFGLDNGTLVVLKCSSAALAAAGWPKLRRTAAQSGLV
jgi:outer membrane protein assembly factor BamB